MQNAFSFTPAEWQLLRELPIQILASAIRADKTSELGLLRQQTRALAELSSRANEYASSHLVQQVFEYYKHEGEGEIQTLQLSEHWHDNLFHEMIDHARQVSQLLETSTISIEEASAYKLWLFDTAATICAVSRIGGILGFGGIRISKNEQTLLDELANAFGIPMETDAS